MPQHLQVHTRRRQQSADVSRTRMGPTLPDPDIWMVQESKSRTHEFPYPHLLEQAQLAQTREGRKDLRHHALFHIWHTLTVR